MLLYNAPTEEHLSSPHHDDLILDKLVFPSLDILGLLQVVCLDPTVHAEVVVVVSVATFVVYVSPKSRRNGEDVCTTTGKMDGPCWLDTMASCIRDNHALLFLFKQQAMSLTIRVGTGLRWREKS
jgi:hypothetical protein